MRPIDDVREISRIAYGFMASKALFAALNLDLFSRLAGGPKTLDALAAEAEVGPSRLLKLLTACVSVGLMTQEGSRYANAPASQAYLVRGAPAYFGDYYRFQIDRQVYPAFQQLDAALRGARGDFYGLMRTPEEAEFFSRAQHAGSLGPAHVTAKLVDLSRCRRALDVGGGSGAFSITLCRRYPELTATIIDFPDVQPVTERFVGEAGLGARVQFLAGNALEVAWPAGQDVVLMSYLASAVAETHVGRLLDRAAGVLAPGGHLLVHDFMVADDRSGPTEAALWLLCAVIADPDCVQLTPEWLRAAVTARGFIDCRVRDVIPGITTLLTARRPDR